MKKTNNQIRRVDYFGISEDYECAFLGALGFSNKCIVRNTRLRPGQISYRLKKAAIRRYDYRDGTSDVATLVLRSLRPTIEKELTHYLKETFLK